MRQRRSNFSTRAIRFWASTGARTLASLSKYRKTSRDGSLGAGVDTMRSASGGSSPLDQAATRAAQVSSEASSYPLT